MDIDVPQDCKSTFEPQIVKKRQKDISDIDQKIISMYILFSQGQVPDIPSDLSIALCWGEGNLTAA